MVDHESRHVVFGGFISDLKSLSTFWSSRISSSWSHERWQIPWTQGDRNGVIAGDWKEAFAAFALVVTALTLGAEGEESRSLAHHLTVEVQGKHVGDCNSWIQHLRHSVPCMPSKVVIVVEWLGQAVKPQDRTMLPNLSHPMVAQKTLGS